MGSQVADQDEITVLVTGFGPFKEQYPQNPSWEIARQLPEYLPPLRAKSTAASEAAAAAAHDVLFFSGTSSSSLSAASSPDQEAVAATAPAPAPALPPVRILVHPEPVRVNYQTVRGLVPSLWDPERGYRGRRVDYAVHIGMAGPRMFYALERQGHRDGYGMVDVDGELLGDEERRRKQGGDWVWYGVPPVLETELDVDDVMKRWTRHSPDDLDLRLSYDAGHYLCDFIYFSSLAHLWKAQERRRVVFLHVPADASDRALRTGKELVIQLIRSVVESELSKEKQVNIAL